MLDPASCAGLGKREIVRRLRESAAAMGISDAVCAVEVSCGLVSGRNDDLDGDEEEDDGLAGDVNSSSSITGSRATAVRATDVRAVIVKITAARPGVAALTHVVLDRLRGDVERTNRYWRRRLAREQGQGVGEGVNAGREMDVA